MFPPWVIIVISLDYFVVDGFFHETTAITAAKTLYPNETWVVRKLN
jgi:hypothetical protein